ncbi:MAG: HD domain-containing protein [Chitinophagales bacterium]|nr:HD domain-containing protein [Chitinophagales bacterium]MBP8752954.1 HD domain-containing protein [Chitinophagales bacterium]MBP9188572.1 HD domain-containing protein [Chitinophagales bacterium]MBP9547934.1 HD domain-containing protein [Chitinophagales bacterium]MBP9704344.1 HD domain-containing protein [Chitinophagales bacterium]
MNKRKILNDPIYGFITIPHEIIYDIIEHPWFQRLRRIQQLGLSNLVYPGANHTRFQHAIGAMHLLGKAVHVLRSKGNEITDAEAEAAAIAVLLHDIGHGPFSHALENTLVDSINHEQLSLIFIDKLNKQFNGRLSLAQKIFTGNYHKKFLHQLVSSQLDVDRLDYLIRDSYFTGVHEGVIGYDRLIEMMDVADDSLVIEQKGIYSVEKFIVSRRIMYWQVYLHKTVICAEQMLIKALKRAKYLSKNNDRFSATPALDMFLYEDFTEQNFIEDENIINNFALLDDSDIYVALKTWQFSEDKVLAYLCSALINRRLFRIELENDIISQKRISDITKQVQEKYQITDAFDLQYFVFHDSTSNSAYQLKDQNIHIKFRNGNIIDVVDASDHVNLASLSDPVVKYYLCYPKDL